MHRSPLSGFKCERIKSRYRYARDNRGYMYIRKNYAIHRFR